MENRLSLVAMLIVGSVFLSLAAACGELGDDDDDDDDGEAYSDCVDACMSDYNACYAICDRYCGACDGNYDACLDRCE